jgi:4-hydroxybenzoate polyprenyltransferase
MTATLDPVRPAHGGPAPRWSPRRLGHHRYLWWLGGLVLAAVAAAIAVGLDTSPGPGVPDDGAVNVLTAVILAAPVLLWGFVHQLISAVKRRVRDDVREYGTGQPVRFRPPDPADAAAGVR